MRRGRGARCCCHRRAGVAGGGRIIGRWATGSCGSWPRGRRGETFQSGTARGRRCTSGLGGGPRTAPGTGSLPICRSTPTGSRGSGSSRSTPPWSAPTSTPRGREKGGGRQRQGRADAGRAGSRGGLRPVPRRADQQAPPRLWRAAGGRWPCCSPPGRPATIRSFPGCWRRSGCPPVGSAGRAPAPSTWSPTKAYSARATRTLLRRRSIRATIPKREDEKAHRRRRGRPGG